MTSTTQNTIHCKIVPSIGPLDEKNSEKLRIVQEFLDEQTIEISSFEELKRFASSLDSEDFKTNKFPGIDVIPPPVRVRELEVAPLKHGKF